MSPHLKILVVDDTIFYRQLLSNLIEEMPDVELAGVASNGKIALKKIELSKPDLVIMDMSMPEMDGLEALGYIKEQYQDINVIMVSGVDREAASLTVKALEKGALDFISKPKASSQDIAFAELKASLTPLIALSKAMKASKETRKYPSQNLSKTPSLYKPQTQFNRPANINNNAKKESLKPAILHTNLNLPANIIKKKEIKRIDVVVIGVSTGGPNTLKNIIPKISKDFPIPILAVQHMPPLFTASLAESLGKTSAIKVVEAESEQNLERGTMYIAPGGHHMVVRKTTESPTKKHPFTQIALLDSPPVHNCRPSVDVLFRSAAMVFGGNVLSVILTGMGHDGLSGVAAIRRKGGYSLAQDEKTSVVWGMPGAVVEAGEADEILPEDQIADRIMEIVKKNRL